MKLYSVIRLVMAISCAALVTTLVATAAEQSGASPAGVRSAGTAITIYMIGDSTMANKPLKAPNPERGWGQILPIYFKENVHIENHAQNGRSTKSFIDEGRWKTVLDRLRPGDYVIIQFGHNDEKKDKPEVF